ncbi:Ser/Thr protein kinase RdoA (MazF antagonist) [Tumebacillus sp. BK434]|uniref:phosphotransferase n=1 Tax=Tumebacillus sp. BK434 TaxID=2512169 RepID=UPI0010F258A4|nr:phosphotransferase [Tumebacillus sp. BK434]TCP54400.1 Ser/Thr protein kinase RdoA (MazF antagonist) [Tumebacillus sp. BK434]
MLTDSLLAKLERAYGLTFSHAVKLRTVTGVRTSGGAMILKRYEGEGMKKRLDALGTALEVVVRSGVEIAPYVKTKENSAYMSDRGALWTLQPWLAGRHLSLHDRRERHAAAAALARLHRVPTARQVEKSFYLRVPPLWEKYRHRLERAQDATLRTIALRDLWRPFAERARQAVRDLQGPSFLRALERDTRRGALCHRDPAPHNFIWQGGSAAIIDFDLAGFDVRAHDLYQLLNHALYLNGHAPGLFQEMVEAYEGTYPLCEDNRRLLHALMTYPSLVIREWYDFGKNGNKKALLPRLEWAALQEEKRYAELKNERHSP